MRIYTLAVLCMLLPFGIIAQDLPASMTPQEKIEYPNYLLNASKPSSASAITTPPSSPVRTMAEWEELHGVLITWAQFQVMLKDIVKASKEEGKVYIVTNNPSSVVNYLNVYNIDTVNVEFVVTSYNSVWSRDYGPWSAYTNDVDTLITVDWIYNRPRPSDDQIPVTMSNLLGTPLYETTAAPWDLIHTGGNFMTDGMGTGFSSKLLLNENPSKTEAVIDTIMKKFMGIDRYIKMDNLPYDVIHHIDMHMKLLDEETILMGEYPLGISDGPQIEANLQYVLSNFNSAFGTPYKVIRIPMPPDATGRYPSNGGNYWTHTNASFVNKTILVPIYGGPSDTTAIRIFQEALPGYNVVGIDSRPSIPSLGAIHCIMKEIGTDDPLLIVHQSLEDTYDDVNPYNVVAEIKHRSGILNADLYFRTDTAQAYNSVSMTNVGSNDWSAQIPAQVAGKKVDYYITAEANSGKTQVRPIVAPDGYFDFNVLQLTSIDEHLASSEFNVGNIFPNPASAITCIPVSFSDNVQFSLDLYDISGRFIKNIFSNMSGTGDQKYFIDASQLSSGVYSLHYRTDSQSEQSKLVIR
ncbi:MAG: T9SS type A sorting domain-containing protein [Bacteroidia bacterium]|nr:T9SS type A sorting domain-containing protein [Bacteroidia bacterium]